MSTHHPAPDDDSASSVFYRNEGLTLYTGDAAIVLRQLSPGSVDCVMISPPAWRLRDYTTTRWSGGRRMFTPGQLTKLEPEHIEKLHSTMRTSGLAAGTVHHVHRTLRASLSEAVRRKHVAVNAAMIAKAPRVEEEEIEPLTVDEAKRLLAAAHAATARAGRWRLLSDSGKGKHGPAVAAG